MLPNILAAIGSGIFMLMSVLGLSSSPHATPAPLPQPTATYYQTANPHAQASADSSAPQTSDQCSATPSHIITEAHIQNNNLYINCKLVQQNIPHMLGLQPSTDGQFVDPNYSPEGVIDGLASEYSYPFSNDGASTPSADLYISATTSPQNDLVAMIYTRVDNKSDSNESPFKTILVYSQTGLVSRFDLTTMNPAIASLPQGYSDTSTHGGIAQGDVLEINGITYVDRQKMYLVVQAGMDSPVDTYYKLSDSTFKFVATTAGGELISPDRSKMAYTPEDTPYISTCGGCLGDSNTSEIDIADFTAGTNYPITHDRTKPYQIVGWSKDGSTLLATVGVTDSTGATADHYTNFFTYNVLSGKTNINSQTNWKDTLTLLCSSGLYERCWNY